MHLWHKWSKWEQYVWSGYEKFPWQSTWDHVMHRMQRRKCEKCGFVQEREID